MLRQVKKYLLATALLQEVSGSVRNSTCTGPMEMGWESTGLATSSQLFLQAILFYVWGQEN